MRVLVVALKFLPASGGSATYAHNLAAGLKESGHTVRVLAPHYLRKNTDYQFDYEVFRMPLTSEFFRGIRILFAALQIWWQYFRFRPDVIWASSFAGCRAIAPLDFLKIPWIGTIHGGGIIRCRGDRQPFLNSWTVRMGQHFIQKARCIVTVSRETDKLIRSLMPEPFLRNEPRVIYNGIEFDPKRFVPRDAALKRHPEFQNKQVLLTVGRLVKAKGHDLVIRAVHLLRDEFPQLHYAIVGEGPEKNNLMELVRSLNLQDRVTFTGYVGTQELEEYYALCDLFVMAGRKTEEFIEGFGLVFIEASLRGKPVIGTRVGGIPEAIEDGYTGMVIEPENPSLLAQQIGEILRDPDSMRRLGSSGKKWVEDQFTTDVMARHNAQLLAEIGLV